MILFFYTALKLVSNSCPNKSRLMILFFYTALKLMASFMDSETVWWSFSFTLLSNGFSQKKSKKPFDDPFLLHCSQTPKSKHSFSVSLMILFFYTALKQGFSDKEVVISLMILFFYTALKLTINRIECFSSLMILFFYTALKRCACLVHSKWVWWSFSFTLLSNLR